MISIAGFSQGKTCAMKFTPDPLSHSPYYATYYLIDTSIPAVVESHVGVQVYDNQENTQVFTSSSPSSSSSIYKYYVYVWDSNGHSGSGWSVSFNAFNYYNNKIPVDIIYLQ